MNKDLPQSKSWAIRMIFMDMLYGAKTGYKIIRYFEKEDKKSLADDIRAALDCAKNYLNGEHIFNVRNSGTVCRFLIYLLDGQKYKIIKGRQLAKRKMNAPKNISKLPLAKLLKLGTSQFASAAILAGVKPTGKLPPKCRLTVEAKKSYFNNEGEWIPKYDGVILGQLRHFLFAEKITNPIAEDYCYLRAFNLITREEGKRRWPELANHECDRLKVMEKICQKGFNRKVWAPDDHRVVMAVAMRQKDLGLPMRVTNKKCVAKSWPRFWEWLNSIK